jgi:hypothetical protein
MLREGISLFRTKKGVGFSPALFFAYRADLNSSMRSSNANPNTIGSSAVGIITGLAMLEPFSSEHVCRSNLTIELNRHCLSSRRLPECDLQRDEQKDNPNDRDL